MMALLGEGTEGRPQSPPWEEGRELTTAPLQQPASDTCYGLGGQPALPPSPIQQELEISTG